MEQKQQRGPSVILYFLAGTFALFVLVLVVFALVMDFDSPDSRRTGLSGFSRKPAVGIIDLEGPIFDSRDFVDTLEEYRKEEKVRAVVVRVDSPGGAVAPSQEIYHAILKLRETGKPVVVSMGSLAASGGYYVSSAANKVLANPGTITGSIGVIMQFANYAELMDKIGVKAQALTNSRGKFKDIGSPQRDMRPEEKKLLQTMMDQVYEQFVRDISYGRGLDAENVYPFADGRIFSGEQALENGFVDGLGGFEDAVAMAAELGGIEDDEPQRIYPREPEPTFWDMLSGEEASTRLLQRLLPGLSGALGEGGPLPLPTHSGGLYYLFVP
ncbi:MAG: signal peptide peptidase SppA [Chrysiogenetes bacterium]|nr:signal peptide peptidase SppA [Chrysiogenetes bacterium]